MTFEGAVVTEQNVTFGILIVKSYVLNNPVERENSMDFGIRAFGRMPIILMTQDSSGTPTYFGRKDIVAFLANISFSRIPWKKYTI